VSALTALAPRTSPLAPPPHESLESLGSPECLDTPERSTTAMNHFLHVDLERAERGARLGEAQGVRAGRRMARAHRLSRKAEQAAQQARLALARAL